MDPDRLMRSMMQGMGSPFGMFDNFMPGGMVPQVRHDPISAMMPHGFMSPMSMLMMDPFQSMQQAMSMTNNGTNGGFSYCSSSVTSYTTDEQGRPQVYQSTNEVKQGPSGIKETKSAVRDSRTGHQELAIGHHIQDRAHIKKKSKNAYTGEEEQAEDFVNLEEAEAETFEQNWMRQAKNITASSHNQIQNSYPYGRNSRNNRLALTSSAQEDLTYPQTNQRHSSTHTSQPDKSAMKTKKKKKSKESKGENLLKTLFK